MSAIDCRYNARTSGESGPLRLTAEWLPMASQLVSDIVVQVPRKADHIAQHLVGDDIRKQPTHVGEHTWMRDELRKDIVLQARGRRLDPAQLFGGGEQRRRELAEEGVRLGHGREGVRLTRCIDYGHRAGRVDDAAETSGLDWRVDD